MNGNNLELRRNIIILGIIALIFVFSIFSFSYALFSVMKEANETNVIKVGNLELSYSELNDSNSLQLVSEFPISDSDGLNGDSYKFNVTNTGTLNLKYRIKIIDNKEAIDEHGCNDNLINPQYLRYTIDSNDVVKLSDAIIGDQYEGTEKVGTYYEIGGGEISPTISENHEVKIWIGEDSPNSVLGRHYHGKIIVEIEQSNGSNP